MRLSLVLTWVVVGLAAAGPVFGMNMPGLEPGGRLNATEFLVDTSLVYLPLLDSQTVPVVVAGDSNYLVVWQQWFGGQTDICATLLGINGEVRNPGSIRIADSGQPESNPAVAFVGACYWVVWQVDGSDGGNIMGTRVGLDGQLLDNPPLVISAALDTQAFPAIVAAGSQALAVWQDRRGSTWDIYATRLGMLGQVLDPAGIHVSQINEDERHPDVAYDGSNFLTVWDQAVSGAPPRICGARVSLSGGVLDPTGLPISMPADSQCFPAVEFGSPYYLVVWDEIISSDRDIQGARVAPAGWIVDTMSFGINSQAFDQCRPAIATNATDFIVTWEDHRAQLVMKSDIYGARVDRNGVVLEPNGVPVSSMPHGQDMPAVAWGFTQFVAVWADRRDSLPERAHIYAARIDQFGQVYDTFGILVSVGVNREWAPAIASDGEGYLVAWVDDRKNEGSIWAARVDSMGGLLEPSPLLVSTDASYESRVAVASNGTDYLVVWDNGATDIYAARVGGASGGLLDSAAILVDHGTYRKQQPCVASDGTNYLAVWADNYLGSGWTVCGQFITAGGMLTDSVKLSTTTFWTGNPAIAFDGSNYLAVWSDLRAMDRQIYGCRVTPTGNVLDPDGFAVCVAGNSQDHPALAFDGSNYLAVWDDDRLGNRDIYGTRISVAGMVLDSPGAVVAAGAGAQDDPTVAYADGQYEVVWLDSSGTQETNLHGRPVSRDMVPGDSFDAVSQPGDQGSPVLAVGSGRLLLAYSGWAGLVQNRTSNAFRIWGKFLGGSIPPPPPDTWLPAAELPVGDRNRKIKDGGSLTRVPPPDGINAQSDDQVYAFKGNRSCEFYRYTISSNSWTTLDSIPAIGSSGKKTGVAKGGTLVGANGHLYASKGNNTLEYWEYLPETDVSAAYAWTEVAGVPLGPLGKKVADGASAVWARVRDTSYVYFLKGNSTREFYRFNTRTGLWDVLPDAPAGISGRTYKKGSCITYNDKDSLVYALKAGVNEFFAFDVRTAAWTTVKNMPLVGSSGRKKKVGAGACMTWCPEYSTVCALKGNNTLEFWKYGTTGDTWIQGQDVQPVNRKKVKAGAAIVYVMRDGQPWVYVFIGNGTLAFERYPPDISDLVAAQVCAAGTTLSLSGVDSPTLLRDKGEVRFTLPGRSRVRLSLLDITGRRQGPVAAGEFDAGSHVLQLDAARLPRGVMFLQLETEFGNRTRKLVLQ